MADEHDAYDEDVPAHVPERMWSDKQLNANSYLVGLLSSTAPPVGLHPFSCTTRFVRVLGCLAEVLGIEDFASIFLSELTAKMGYDMGKVLEGLPEWECRLPGV
jgi:hypothetical protein